jgi:hypothetical protein
MASLQSAHFADPHFACLDLVRIVNGCALPEDAVLMEIWEHGATVQTSVPIAAGSTIGIVVEQKEVAGEVTRCEADQDFGYLVDVDISEPNEWFPKGYRPAWQKGSDNAARDGAGYARRDFVC